MHPALSEFPSNLFYDGTLQNGVTVGRPNKIVLIPLVYSFYQIDMLNLFSVVVHLYAPPPPPGSGMVTLF